MTLDHLRSILFVFPIFVQIEWADVTHPDGRVESFEPSYEPLSNILDRTLVDQFEARAKRGRKTRPKQTANLGQQQQQAAAAAAAASTSAQPSPPVPPVPAHVESKASPLKSVAQSTSSAASSKSTPVEAETDSVDVAVSSSPPAAISPNNIGIIEDISPSPSSSPKEHKIDDDVAMPTSRIDSTASDEKMEIDEIPSSLTVEVSSQSIETNGDTFMNDDEGKANMIEGASTDVLRPQSDANLEPSVPISVPPDSLPSASGVDITQLVSPSPSDLVALSPSNSFPAADSADSGQAPKISSIPSELDELVSPALTTATTYTASSISPPSTEVPTQTIDDQPQIDSGEQKEASRRTEAKTKKTPTAMKSSEDHEIIELD